MLQPGGPGIVVRQGIPARQIVLPKGAPRNEADTLTQTLWHSTGWCHVLEGLGWGRMCCMPKWRTASSPSRPSTGSSGATPRGTCAAGRPPSW